MYSIETDSSRPPMMLLKIDIAKAYDMVEWGAALATLYLMKFPSVWINWVRACISSASFAILINGHITDWFSSGRVQDKEILCLLTSSCRCLKISLLC